MTVIQFYQKIQIQNYQELCITPLKIYTFLHLGFCLIFLFSQRNTHLIHIITIEYKNN